MYPSFDSTSWLAMRTIAVAGFLIAGGLHLQALNRLTDPSPRRNDTARWSEIIIWLSLVQVLPALSVRESMSHLGHARVVTLLKQPAYDDVALHSSIATDNRARMTVPQECIAGCMVNTAANRDVITTIQLRTILIVLYSARR